MLLTYAAGILVLLAGLTIYIRRWGDDSPAAADGGDPEAAHAEVDEDSRIGLVGSTLGRTSRILASHPMTVLAIALVLSGVGFQVASSLGTLADTEEFIPQDLPAYVDLQQFRSQTGGGTSTSYDVLVTGTHLKHPETLRWMDGLNDVATQAPLSRRRGHARWGCETVQRR